LVCLEMKDRCEPFAKVTPFVIPAKAGIQNRLKIQDSGSPPASAGVARNDDFLLIEDFCKGKYFDFQE
jgi:hypothetical protein